MRVIPQEATMQILQDPSSQLALITAAVGAFITVVVQWLFTSFSGWWSRVSRQKQITFKLKVTSIALQLSEELRTGQIIVRNNPISNNIYSLTLEVKNTGGQNINLSDYVPNTRIGFELGSGTIILEAQEIKYPRGISSMPITLSSDSLAIDPIPLSKKDFITVRMLVTDWAAKIDYLMQLNDDVQQTLLFKPLSWLNIKNHILRAIIICALQLLMFFFISSGMLGSYVVQIPQGTDQALGFSLFVGGLIAALMSIALIFSVCDLLPFRVHTKKRPVKIGKMRQFLAARNILTAWLLLIIAPCVFYVSNIFILNNAFNLDLVNSPFIGYSIFWGGLITTLLILLVNILLSWLFPLREFAND
jgi:hypothetical protein